MSSVLIYGGSGALGSTLVNYFKQKSWKVLSIDTRTNSEAETSIILDLNKKCKEQSEEILKQLENSSIGKFDAIINVAGGFAMGNASSTELFETSELMWKQSVNSSLIASHISSKYLKENGLLVLTGAAGALGGSSFAIGYGMAKAAVHQLTASLAQDNSGLPKGAKVIAIAPVMLDTPNNRKDMPSSDFSSWTPLSHIASELYDYACGEKSSENGRVYKIVTKGGNTQFE
ncbi:NAD(P)-binding protein [Neoconidiobolus thromboides FSU 785]|nr:NAD(P)-binding protein [Neoconidiobolus thromboides FSU 785]